MVAGGGASVIYSDTICDLGGASELANYGEYSGNHYFYYILNHFSNDEIYNINQWTV